MAVMTYREALNLALREEMTRDDRVFEVSLEAVASLREGEISYALTLAFIGS